MTARTATMALTSALSISTITAAKFPKGAHGSIRLDAPTFLERAIAEAACQLFDRISDPELLVRWITISANRIVKDEGFYQFDLFTDSV